MKDNKENTLASAELRDMINHAMINKRNSEADEDLKSSIAKAMDKKTSTGKIPSAEHSKNSDSIHSEPKIKAEKKKLFSFFGQKKKTNSTDACLEDIRTLPENECLVAIKGTLVKKVPKYAAKNHPSWFMVRNGK